MAKKAVQNVQERARSELHQSYDVSKEGEYSTLVIYKLVASFMTGWRMDFRDHRHIIRKQGKPCTLPARDLWYV
jgi:hypothetical protein